MTDAAPTWAILIPTIGQREALFLRLLNVLLPQLDEHSGRVRVLAWRNHGAPRLAELRDKLVADADSDYVSFIDDDDLVPDYYVSEIVRALESRPDHVGFKLGFSSNGTGYEVVEHSLKYHRWGRSAEGVLYRDLTHVDPIRRELAMFGRFAAAKAGRAEDRVWVRQIRPVVMTEVYIDKIMYEYLWEAEASSWARPDEQAPRAAPRPVVDHPHFSWHPGSDT